MLGELEQKKQRERERRRRKRQAAQQAKRRNRRAGMPDGAASSEQRKQPFVHEQLLGNFSQQHQQLQQLEQRQQHLLLLARSHASAPADGPSLQQHYESGASAPEAALAGADAATA